MAQALNGLADEDRLILKLYPRFRALLTRLRGAMEAQGLSVHDAHVIIGDAELGEDFELLAVRVKMRVAEPSPRTADGTGPPSRHGTRTA